MIIYKATNKVNRKVYIGLSTTPLSVRITKHKYNAFKLCTNGVFQKALRKYGVDGFEWEEIDESDNFEELCLKEKNWISQFRTFVGFEDCWGYNSTLGGEGNVKYSQGSHQYHLEERAKERKRRREYNAIFIYDVNGVFIGEYGSQLECGEKLDGMHANHLSSLLSGKRYVLNGFIAIYKREFTEQLLENRLEKANGVRKGEMASQSLLSEEDVIEIKRMILNKFRIKDIASRFKVAPSTISSIKRGQKWKHVMIDGWEEFLNNRKVETRLSEEDVINIKLKLIEGVKGRQLAKDYNVTENTISCIKCESQWRHVLVDGWEVYKGRVAI